MTMDPRCGGWGRGQLTKKGRRKPPEMRGQGGLNGQAYHLAQTDRKDNEKPAARVISEPGNSVDSGRVKMTPNQGKST